MIPDAEHLTNIEAMPTPCRVVFSRAWAMPSMTTFTIPPIREFVAKYLRQSCASIDPFASNSDLATYTNDIDLATTAQSHRDAEYFVRELSGAIRCDLALFDPPYSPRQMAEHYNGRGRASTQTAALYCRVREALDVILDPGAIVLSFGWHSNGMGKGRGYELIEMLIVAHGGAHNDTICIAERKS